MRVIRITIMVVGVAGIALRVMTARQSFAGGPAPLKRPDNSCVED